MGSPREPLEILWESLGPKEAPVGPLGTHWDPPGGPRDPLPLKL